MTGQQSRPDNAAMRDLSSLLSRTRARIRDLEQRLRDARRKLGRAAWEREAGPPKGTEKALVERLQTLDQAIADLALRKDQVIELRDKIAVLEQDQRDNRKQIADLERNTAPLYQAIGEAVATVYQAGSQPGDEMASLFAPVHKAQRELQELEEELEQLEGGQEQKRVVERALGWGRLTVLRSRIAGKRNQLPGLFRQLGEAVTAQDAVADLDGGPVADAIEPFSENRRERQALVQAGEALAEELSAAREALEQIAGGQRVPKVLDDLQSQRDSQEREREGALVDLGAALENSDDAHLGEPDLVEAKGAVGALHQKRDALENLASRLESALEIRRLERGIQNDEHAIESARKAIAEREQEIGDREAAIATAKKDVTRLKKARGNEDQLLETVDETLGTEQDA